MAFLLGFLFISEMPLEGTLAHLDSCFGAVILLAPIEELDCCRIALVMCFPGLGRKGLLAPVKSSQIFNAIFKK